MAYGSTPTVMPLYSGLEGGDTPSSLTSQPTCTTTATNTSSVAGIALPGVVQRCL